MQNLLDLRCERVHYSMGKHVGMAIIYNKNYTDDVHAVYVAILNHVTIMTQVIL